MQLDMVRPGILSYGYYPGGIQGGKMLLRARRAIDVEPVMDVVTQLSTIKALKAGETVSYGRRWKSEHDTKIGTLPLGYADGLLRRFSPGVRVAIRGGECPISGTICMDQCMVDLHNAPDAEVGDDVTVFGAKKRGALLDAGDFAELASTIPYEVLTSISQRVPRIIQA
jgi:alanine racemase